MILRSLSLIFLLSMSLPLSAIAQGQEGATFLQDRVTYEKARVVDILSSKNEQVAGTKTTTDTQSIQVEILEGTSTGKMLTIENDYLMLRKGEVFFLQHTVRGEDGRDYYSVSEPYRIPTLVILTILFVLCILVFGGVQGLRGLVTLVGSFALIIYVLLPGLLSGYSPLLLTVGVSLLIIIPGSYITHGFNKTTSSAVLGMIATVALTGLLAHAVVLYAHLSGFASEESVYLNLNTNGSIDMAGLLFGGIMIGLLGVLYDVAIGQAISVEELHLIAPHVGKKTIYRRALRIGREHIGALINTLAIAYVGVSLPLLLLLLSSQGDGSAPLLVTLNKEIFSTEIVRILIGSIGIIIAVPLTTLVSVFLVVKRPSSTEEWEVAKERESLEKIHHH